MRSQIALEEILGASAESLRNSLVHCLPGVVQAYHAGAPGRAATVDVQPAIHDVRTDIETGLRVSEPWPVLLGVPVSWPKFGGFVIAGPLAAGDHVILHAVDLDPGPHRTSGRAEDPADTRRHGGNYWVAVPGDITDPGAPADGATAGGVLVLGRDGGEAQIRISASTIQLGAGGNDALGLASKIDAAVSAIVNAFNAHTHVAPSGGGPTAPPAAPISSQPSCASTIVKAD